MMIKKMRFIRRFAVFFMILIVCLIFCHALFKNFHYLGIGDWDQHFFYAESVVKTIRDYGQLPLWNPWYCGGMVLFQNSQVPSFTPFAFLHLFLDTPQAMKVSIILHYVIALGGMYVIGKRLFKINSFFLILVGAGIFVFNSFISLQLTEGHTWILPFAYIPFVFFFFEKYIKGRKKIDLILSALGISLMIFEGGIYPVPLTVLFLILYSLFKSILTRNKDYFLALIELGLFSFLLSSIKLIPLYDYMSVYPRHITGPEMIPPGSLADIFLRTEQHRGLILFKEQQYGWHEYGCYVGVHLAILFVVSLVAPLVSGKKKAAHITLLVCFLVFFMFFLGNVFPLAPYALLKSIPPFKSLHVSGRFVIILTFIAALTVFGLLQMIEETAEKSKGNISAYA